MSRRTVKKVVEQVEQARGDRSSESTPRVATSRASKLDAHDSAIADLVARYPDISARRIHEELRLLGHQGGYTLLSARVRRFRPSPVVKRVRRFETAPGELAQMDYSTYDFDFTDEGRRRVHAFSYLLGYPELPRRPGDAVVYISFERNGARRLRGMGKATTINIRSEG